MNDETFSIGGSFTRGQHAALAVLMELTAPKPGSVHRAADFEDVSFFHFAAGAVAAIPAIDSAARGATLGQIVAGAITATRAAVGTNTNLGTVLLVAPLALVDDGESLAGGIARVLDRTDTDDARLIYEAIRQAQPGGLGRVEQYDIAGAPPPDLLAAMRAAARHDLVARQYTNGFQQVREGVVPLLRQGIARDWSLSDTIIRTHVQLMADFPDSLIARKCGPRIAQESADRAARVLDAGLPGDENYVTALSDFDFWLRSDGHRRNPGTTADLIAAGLFAALRLGIIEPPYRWVVA